MITVVILTIYAAAGLSFIIALALAARVPEPRDNRALKSPEIEAPFQTESCETPTAENATGPRSNRPMTIPNPAEEIRFDVFPGRLRSQH